MPRAVIVTEGSCARPGERTWEVGPPVRVTGSGSATSDGLPPVPTRAFLDGGHPVRVVHGTPRAALSVLACADPPDLQRATLGRSAMHTLESIYRGIAENLPLVLQRFDEVTREEPWVTLPADYRASSLGEVAACAAELALRAPHDRDLCRRLLESAAEHGETRLKQGFPDTLLFQEMYLLRRALWGYLRQHHSGATELSVEAIVRIDMALSLAAKASIRGFHRPVFEARGDWARAVGDLASAWRPPPPVG